MKSFLDWMLALLRHKPVQVQQRAFAQIQAPAPRANLQPLQSNAEKTAVAPAVQRRRVPTPGGELTALLNLHAGARTALPELAYVETTLQVDPDGGLALVPPPVLQRALAQLQGVADLNKSPRLALLELQIRRLVGAGLAREQAGQVARPLVTQVETAEEAPADFADTVIEGIDERNSSKEKAR